MYVATIKNQNTGDHATNTGECILTIALHDINEDKSEAKIHTISAGLAAPANVYHIGYALCSFINMLSKTEEFPDFIDLYQLMLDGICEAACNEIYKEKKDKKKLLRYRMTKNLIYKLIKKYIKS